MTGISSHLGGAHPGRHAFLAEYTSASDVTPAFGSIRDAVNDGALVFFGLDDTALLRTTAAYVDKILKGAHPRDLPVEQPTRFLLVINLKTARAPGLTIPPSLIERADQVIE